MLSDAAQFILGVGTQWVSYIGGLIGVALLVWSKAMGKDVSNRVFWALCLIAFPVAAFETWRGAALALRVAERNLATCELSDINQGALRVVADRVESYATAWESAPFPSGPRKEERLATAMCNQFDRDLRVRVEEVVQVAAKRGIAIDIKSGCPASPSAARALAISLRRYTVTSTSP